MKYKVNVRLSGRVTITPTDIAGLLDMLRYDRAVVVSWSDDGDGIFTIYLEADNPSFDRWRSFMLYPETY